MAWAPDYCTDDQFKEYVRVSDDVDDAAVAWAITAASRSIDHSCGRQFGLVAAPEERYYAPRWDPRAQRWTIPCDDFMTETGLTVDIDLDGDLTYDHTVPEVIVAPQNAVAKGKPWTELIIPSYGTIQPTDPLVDQALVTARWGWTSVPDTIVQATLLQASRLISRRDAPFGVAGSPTDGSEMRLLAKVDPDVQVMLRGYRRMWGAA